MSKPIKVYPIRDRWLQGVPSAVQTLATKGEADELVASGAFTDDPRHPERNHDAPELDAAPEREVDAEAPEADQPIAEPEPA